MKIADTGKTRLATLNTVYGWMNDMAYIEDGIWPGVHGWVNG